ncbi:hypothetical protein ACGFYQ_19500 [Streptomyces sp. NPDC048258]|uniref:hypothetical protein n=1 Tax=Streptomyces sp. NPDC048258 TaxID=3365527 RepID=UPI0037120C08
MEAQRGRTDRRGLLRLLGGSALLLTGAAAGGYVLWPEGPPPDPERVRTDTEPLRARFASFGEMTDAHWLGYDINKGAYDDRSIPGPESRIRVVGLARLPQGRAMEAIRRPRPVPFSVGGLSDIPDPLRKFVPAGAVWQNSPDHDLEINTAPSSADHVEGHYFLDAARDLVWFDAVFLYA